MKFKVRTALKILLIKIWKSPVQTFTELCWRFLPVGDISPQVQRMREITRKSPLILQIETTNVCNSACVFCAFPTMERKKGVMSPSMFQQVVNEYAAMGGGPVSLTPLVGDPLLDPHLLDRLETLKECPHISQISFTTNAIALERYSDKEVLRILDVLDCIQVSIGGLDATTYNMMYGVDQFEKVQKAMERLLTLKDNVTDPPYLNFAFRTNDWRFEHRFRKQIDMYRRRGAFVSHIWTYANYAGLVQDDNKMKLEVSDGKMVKGLTCIYPSVHMAIGRDGRITACGCTDFEGKALKIGQVGEGVLAQVWSGKKRKAILDSFAAGKLPRICQKCSAYKPDTGIFANSLCKTIEPHQPLPPEYFQQFWGG